MTGWAMILITAATGQVGRAALMPLLVPRFAPLFVTFPNSRRQKVSK
jgi:hypothetical protein